MPPSRYGPEKLVLAQLQYLTNQILNLINPSTMAERIIATSHLLSGFPGECNKLAGQQFCLFEPLVNNPG